MNKELLLKVKEQILKEPKQFNMDNWFTRAPGVPNCGTACCIAGWALTLNMAVSPNVARLSTADLLSSEIECAAAELLDTSDAHKLFYVCNWPLELRHRYISSWRYSTVAQVAADAIDWFIENYE